MSFNGLAGRARHINNNMSFVVPIFKEEKPKKPYTIQWEMEFRNLAKDFCIGSRRTEAIIKATKAESPKTFSNDEMGRAARRKMYDVLDKM